MQEQPLIITLKIDEKSQAFFDAQSNKYFPTERNFLKAHLTLFHQLPNEQPTFDFFGTSSFKTFPMKVAGLRNTGAGVAYQIQSEELVLLHRALSTHFSEVLIPQDRQGFRPHITIQNKVVPERARLLYHALNNTFEPFEIYGTGLDLWTYLGGPLRHEPSSLF